MKFLEENIGINLCALGSGKGFLDDKVSRTCKQRKTGKLDFLTIKAFSDF